MNILSLFDGLACGMLAMLKAGTQVDNYYAYEIDKYAIQTATHNFPQIQECGDVFEGDYKQYEGVDYLIGGSPCQRWSIAQSPDRRETTASGIGWELFSQYVRALHEAKPKFFIYENNKSMAAAIRQSITETFGFEPICINSALLSAQNRQRLYWVGKRNADGTYSKVDVQQPEDRGILLRDVLDGAEPIGTTKDGKAYCLSAGYSNGSGEKIGNYAAHTLQKGCKSMVAEPVNVTAAGKAQCLRATCYKDGVRNIAGNDIDKKTGLYAIPIESGKELTENEMDYMVRGHSDRRWNHCQRPKQDEKAKCLVANISKGVPYNVCAIPVEFEDGIPIKTVSRADGKTYTVYEVKSGNITIKGKTYPIKLIDGYYIIRKLTVSECKRLQTVPEWYEFLVSDTQAYKMLGNGWTVDVIAHLIEATKTGKTVEKIEQLSLF